MDTCFTGFCHGPKHGAYGPNSFKGFISQGVLKMKKFGKAVSAITCGTIDFMTEHPYLTGALGVVSMVGSAAAETTVTVPDFDTAPMISASGKVFAVIALFVGVGLAFKMFYKAN
jgi:hypothetical protein